MTATMTADRLEHWSGIMMLVLAVGTLAAILLAALSSIRRQRTPQPPAPIGFFTGSLPLAAAMVTGLVAFFLLAFVPWIALLPAVLFAAWTIGVTRRRGLEWRDRAGLLGLLAFLWLALTVYGVLMDLWSATVSGPIRVDLLITSPMAAIWTFLGVHLRRELPVPPGPVAANYPRRREEPGV